MALQQGKRQSIDVIKDWAKYLEKDFSDEILKKASRDFHLLESIQQVSRQLGPEKFETEFTYLLHGAFVDMGVGRSGYGTFKPRKWYSPQWSYAVNKLGEMMYSKYGKLGMVRMLEAFPNIIKM